jgi:Protein of unknown function (DUF402)
MWSSGDAALLRYVHDGRVSRIFPVNVVADEPGSVQLFIAAGTRIRARAGLDGRPIPRDLPYEERFALAWRLGDDVWSGHHVLMLTPRATAHSFWAHWDEEWRFEGWYVNLQEPLRETRLGWDTADEVLDVVVGPDLVEWRWKDEHELRAAVAAGRFTEDDAERLRGEGERAVATLERREWPFDRDLSGWRPDPRWPRPQLQPDAEAP